MKGRGFFILTNIILTQPQGILGIPGSSTTDVIIPSIINAPNNVVVVDTSEYSAVKWIYTIFDEAIDKSMMAEILAVRRGGSPANPIYNRYGIVGDSIKHKIDVIMVGSNLGLEITNLHINQLTSSIIQIQVGPP